MKKRLAMALAAAVLTVGMLPGLAVAGDGPNQGNPAFVDAVENPFFQYHATCTDIKAGPKIEDGDLGRFLFVSSYKPIYKVTIKSGRDNEVWGWFFDYGTKAKIKSEKDISNYVVWVCKHWELNHSYD